MPTVIHWDNTLGDPEKSAFVGTIDDTDCMMWEKRAHFHLNVDKSYFSKKSNGAGLKYEIVMDITKAKCLSIVGPNKASEHDMTVFCKSTKEKMKCMPKGKMLIADSIFKAGRKAHQRDKVGMFSIPSSTDDAKLKRFKSRARARHESFNGRLKCFSCLAQSYRGTDEAKHGAAFRAIAIIVQYQMDLGSPIFEIN